MRPRRSRSGSATFSASCPTSGRSATRCGTRSSRASSSSLFSREGRRFEFENLVGFARDNDLTCAFVTGAPGPDGKNAGRLARNREVVIELPSLERAHLVPATVYGGGDFELAAYFFQEALVTRIGLRGTVPPSDVSRNHVD